MHYVAVIQSLSHVQLFSTPWLSHTRLLCPSNEYSGLISFRTDWFDFLAVQGTLKSLLHHHSSNTLILWHSAFFMAQLLSMYYWYYWLKCLWSLYKQHFTVHNLLLQHAFPVVYSSWFLSNILLFIYNSVYLFILPSMDIVIFRTFFFFLVETASVRILKCVALLLEWVILENIHFKVERLGHAAE